MDSLTTKQGVSNTRCIDNYADYANGLITLRDVINIIGTFPSSLLTSFGIFSPFFERFEDES